jgi:hypothetical protein
MTALQLVDAREAADLAAFLARLIHYDRAAAVRLRAGSGLLAVFGRPASFDVLAIRTVQLAETSELDTTVSAGRLADAVDAALDGGRDTPHRGARGPAGAPAVGTTAVTSAVTRAAAAAEGATACGPEGGVAGITVTVPEPVTGPPWAGVLPPRGGWRRVVGLPGADEMRIAVAASVSEFRARIAALPDERRTRAELDRVGREIWSRPLGDTGLPLRAAHAARSLGFLRPGRDPVPVPHSPGAVTTGVLASPADAEPLALLAAGAWLRLRTPYGSIAVHRGGRPGLTIAPA